MNTLKTLFFPDTVVYTDRQYPVFLLFAPINIIQPVERGEDEDNNPTDTFMDDLFCQVHTPSPLGEDRSRFLQLVEDIKNRKDDYAAQLSALTVASMSTTTGPGDATSQEIMSSILGRRGKDQSEENERNEERLWQARLVLKIGEILDQEEEEVAHALTFLDSTETEVFDQLQGNDDNFPGNNPYQDLLELKKRINAPRRETIGNRVRAWRCILERHPAPHWPIWLTTRMEAADILLDEYEKRTGDSATTLFKTLLPAKTGKSPEDGLRNIRKFMKEASPLQKDFTRIISVEAHQAESSKAMDSDLRKWQESWVHTLESAFPEKNYGRTPLTFYLMKNIPLFSLCGGDMVSTEDKDGVLAVLG